MRAEGNTTSQIMTCLIGQNPSRRLDKHLS